MQTQALSISSRRDDEQPSALSYWGTGFAGIALMLVFCFLAGLRF